MTMGLEGRIAARRHATFHVQLQLDKSAPPDASAALSREMIRGDVVRIFRGSNELGLGDQAGFEIWVCEPGDEPTGPAYIYKHAYIGALYLEAYLDGKPPNCKLLGYELAVIDTPTDEPIMTVEQLEQLNDQRR
jgi:hypothetical protein